MFTSFDACYDESVSQIDIFRNEIAPALNNVFTGHSTTVFAFGMTGTGKVTYHVRHLHHTSMNHIYDISFMPFSIFVVSFVIQTHTMQGKKGDVDAGIIPRIMSTLFNTIQQRIAAGTQKQCDTKISVSYLELYCEKVYDLLEPKECDLPVREDTNGKVTVAGLAECCIENVETFHKLYDTGNKNRKIGATKLNAKSSRSHSMIIIKHEYKSTTAPFKKITGKMHLIDLAGK